MNGILPPLLCETSRMPKPHNIVNDPNYRPNVGIMIINQGRQVLAGEAWHYPGEWMMPQGGIDVEESPFQAMQRQPLEKEGRVYIGQRQKWFLLEYDGPLPDATQTLDKEFTRFNWVEPIWLMEHTTKFKVDLYKEIFTAFDFENVQIKIT